ncbi:MAG: AsmA family protein [Deltaproteobacteria bacterium]
MLKKLLITIGAIVAVIVVLVIVAGVIVYLKVDKTFISSQMSRALNRQVTIEKIDISIFSVLSGIEIKNVVISNFKTPHELESVQGKPVAAGDVFTSMESFRFKVKILPLLKREVELKELVLYSPVINLSRNKQGVMNIDDLVQSKKPADKEDKRQPKEKEPARPLSADDLPVAIAVGEIGMKNGAINYYDGEYDQKIQIYKLTTLAYGIAIDPKDLGSKDQVNIKMAMGIKTVGAMKTGSVENFDVTLEAAGKVVPFDLKTRLLDPEATLHIAVPDGEITGLQLFNAIASIPILGDYLGENISFLKGKQQWQGSKLNGLDLHYKAAKAEITNGRLELKEADMLFDGGMNIDTKAIDMNLGMVMKKEVNEAVRATLAKKIESLIKSPEVKKYADSGALAGIAMTPLLNRDGRIALKAKVGGTTRKPVVKLTEPQLGSLSKLVQDQAGSVALEAGKGAAKKLLKEDQQKVLEDVEGLFKKK